MFVFLVWRGLYLSHSATACSPLLLSRAPSGVYVRDGVRDIFSTQLPVDVGSLVFPGGVVFHDLVLVASINRFNPPNLCVCAFFSVASRRGPSRTTSATCPPWRSRLPTLPSSRCWAPSSTPSKLRSGFSCAVQAHEACECAFDKHDTLEQQPTLQNRSRVCRSTAKMTDRCRRHALKVHYIRCLN